MVLYDVTLYCVLVCSMVCYGMGQYCVVQGVSVHGTVLCSNVLSIRYGIVRNAMVCYGVVWYAVTVCHTIPYYIIQQSARPYNSLQYNAMVWRGIVLWYYTILYGIVFYGVAWCDIVLYGMMCYWIL